jgi:periplasmic protein TonB
MFEETLLDSSPRRVAVLCRTHYLISFLAGGLVFALSLCLLPMVLAPAGEKTLYIAAGLIACAAALDALMLAYVRADARLQRLHTGLWFATVLLLNLPGFLIYLVYSAWKTGDWKRAAIPLAYVAEAMIVGVMVLVPLIYTQALPRQLLIERIPVPPPPAGPPPGRVVTRPAAPPTHPAVNPLVAPPTVPRTIAMFEEQPVPPQLDVAPAGPYVPGAISGPGGNGYVIGATPWETSAPPPPPPAVHPVPQPSMIRLSSGVVAAKGVYQPKPPYPDLARIARIQGTVVLQAIIGKDGSIQDLKVLSGQPLLNNAALDAVKTWRYQPTLLNNQPVEVLTEIDVIFKLGD